MKKTVLIIGAGISRAAVGSAAPAKRPPLDTDFFDIASRIYPKLTKDILDCLNDLVGDYANTLQSSLEASATYLYIKAIDSSLGSPYHTSFLNLLTLLSAVLAKNTNDLKLGPRSLLYRFLLGELRQAGAPENMTVITFNYDTLIERTLEEIDNHGHAGTFSFPGCYRLSGHTRVQSVAGEPRFVTEEYDNNGVGVLKLHGSMNWQSTHTSSTPTPSALFSTRRKLHILNSPNVVPSLSWKRKKRTVYMQPVIIPPISGKRNMMHQELLQIWDEAAKRLGEADRVVLAGYSCPPLDLEARILLSENLRLKGNKKVYVIDPNPSIAATYVELCGVDHTTVYTSLKHWARDAV